MTDAIGVFDSGIGGLTVVREIMKLLPNERIVYFGDTARVPYGGKSEETIKKFAIEDANFLIRYEIKMMVVACNTVSATSMDLLKNNFNLPLIGVIEPGARSAVKSTKNGKIGVIGTESTIRSTAYEKAIRRLKENVEIYARSCPLFVPLVEEGWIDEHSTFLIAEKYLDPLRRCGIDTLLLGCTHYPLLKQVISRVMGKSVKLIDSAEETAIEVKQTLENLNMLSNENNSNPFHQFFVSDLPPRFNEIAERCLGRKIENVVRVDLWGK